MREHAVEVNKEWSQKLGVNQSTSITCVKPSGTVSQLVDSASGIHPRFAPYYLRSVRNDIKVPVCQFLIDQGVATEPCVMKTGNQTAFCFSQKAPEGALCKKEVS